MSEAERSDAPETPVGTGPKLTITANAEYVKELFRDFDNFRRFQLEIAAKFYDKTSDYVSSGTGLYEKLIVLNGATIALSISFIGFLSSRVTAAHFVEKPHLWMVAVAWSLLILSIYFSYQVIVHRRSVLLRFLHKTSKEHAAYGHQRLGVLLQAIASLGTGTFELGGKEVDFAKTFQAMKAAVDEEHQKVQTRFEDLIKPKTNEIGEGVWATLAVWSTIIAVAFLCTFTIRSLHLMF